MSKIKRTFQHKNDDHEYTVRVVVSADVIVNGKKMPSSKRMELYLKETIEDELKRISYWFDPNDGGVQRWLDEAGKEEPDDA